MIADEETAGWDLQLMWPDLASRSNASWHLLRSWHAKF